MAPSCSFPRMATLLLLAAFSLQSAIASLPAPLIVKGRVYCDVCNEGHVTKTSLFLAGAEVAVSCVSKDGKQTAYVEGKTDEEGTFSIPVSGDHAHERCIAGVTRSSLATCNVRTRKAVAVVYLNRNSGLASDIINTGPFSFTRKTISAACEATAASEAQPQGYSYTTPSPKPPSSPSPVFQPPSPPPPVYKPPYKPPTPVYKPPYKPPTPVYKPPYKPPTLSPPPPVLYKPSPSPPPPVYKPPSTSPVYKPPPPPYKPPYSSPSPVTKPPPLYQYPPSPPY